MKGIITILSCVLWYMGISQTHTFNLLYDNDKRTELAYFATEIPGVKQYLVSAISFSGSFDALQILKVSDSGSIIDTFSLALTGNHWFPENILLDDTLIVLTGTIYNSATAEYQTFLFWCDTAFTSPSIKYYPHGAGFDGGKKVKKAIGGGYIVAALSRTLSGGTDGQNYIFKVDSLGNKEWELIQGDSTRNEEPYDVIQLADSNFLVLSRRVYPSNDNILLLKISHDGQLLWDKEIMTGTQRIGSSIVKVNDSTILVSGQGSSGRAFVQCFDTSGTPKWTEHYTAGTGSFWHSDKVNDSTYVFAGAERDASGNVDGLLILLRPNGDEIWRRNISPYGKANDPSNDYFYGVLATSDGGFLCTGFTGTGPISGTQDAWIMKLDSNGLCDTPTCFPWLVSVAPQPEQALLHLWPNPATEVVYINLPQPTGTLTLTNVAGKAVLRQPVRTTIEQLLLQGLHSGLYVVQWLRDGEAPVTGKVMVVD